MSWFRLSWGLAGAGLLLLFGACSDEKGDDDDNDDRRDPIIGRWEITEPGACGTTEFTVEENLQGTGTMYLEAVECLTCYFGFGIEPKENRHYRIDITLNNCDCQGDQSVLAHCDLNEAGTELSCEMEYGVGAACGTENVTFVKK